MEMTSSCDVAHDAPRTAQALSPRWLAFAVGLALESISGLQYAFGFYSGTMKDLFRLQQSELNIVGFVGNLGSNVTPHLGVFNDKYGARASCMFGGFLCCLGWLGTWFAFTQCKDGGNPGWLWWLALCNFCQCHGPASLDTAAVTVLSESFPEVRGKVMSCAKALLGLSGALCTVTYLGLFNPDLQSYLFTVAVVFAVASVVGTMLLKQRSLRNDLPETTLNNNFAVAYCMITVILAMLLSGTVITETRVQTGLAISSLCVFAGLLLFVGTRRDQQPLGIATGPCIDNRVESTEPVMEQETTNRFVDMFGFLFELDFYLIGAGTGITSGSAYAVMNNLPQIASALKEERGMGQALVSLFSISSCVGRIAIGIFVDYTLQKCRTPRALWLMSASIVMSCGHFAFYSAAGGATLYVAVLLVGCSFGAVNALLPMIVGDQYQPSVIGTVYNMTGLNYALFTYLFSNMLVGMFYGVGQPTKELQHDCIGRNCFGPTFAICGAACIVNAALMLCLVKRTRAAAR